MFEGAKHRGVIPLCTVTEIIWIMWDLVSRFPNTQISHLPSSGTNSWVPGPNTVEVSIASGATWWVRVSSSYVLLFFPSAGVANAPTWETSCTHSAA